MSLVWRMVVGGVLIASGGAILIDGGLTPAGLSRDTDPLVLVIVLFLVLAGAFWGWDRDSPPEPQ